MKDGVIVRPDRGTLGPSSRGFTLIEVLLCVAIVGLLAATAIPVYQGAIAKARRAALAADLHELYSAFMRYSVDHGRFPTDSGLGGLDTTTLSPLSTGGYFDNVKSLQNRLTNKRILFYWAPDWNGPDADFIVIATPVDQPNVMVYAMHYGINGAFGYDGVYFLINGQLVRSDGKS
jgi:prepilin-type N-terminal cleavage/methylation domain-containing protein